MKTVYKSKNYSKIFLSETSTLTPKHSNSVLEGRCDCGKPSDMVWVNGFAFSLANKYWCAQCFEKEGGK